MSLGFCSLASGSSGNCYLIKNDNTVLLLDAGISFKAIKTGLESFGILPGDIDGILITHDHIDHVKGLRTLLKKTDCPLYASEGTLDAIVKKQSPLPYERFTEVRAGESFAVGGDGEGAVKITPFGLSHDTEEPISFSFETGGKKAAVVTDTGYVSEEIFRNIRDCELLALEANHERNILLYGSYPYPLKLRILSDLGHLSNEACAHALLEILKETAVKPKVFLAHLSQENNTPEQALITVRNILEEGGFVVGRDLELDVLKRGEPSAFVTI